MTCEELKAQMMKAVEAEIDELVAWEAASEKMTLSEIEEKLLAARQRISQRLASQVIEQSSNGKRGGTGRYPRIQ